MSWIRGCCLRELKLEQRVGSLVLGFVKWKIGLFVIVVWNNLKRCRIFFRTRYCTLELHPRD